MSDARPGPTRQLWCVVVEVGFSADPHGDGDEPGLADVVGPFHRQERAQAVAAALDDPESGVSAWVCDLVHEAVARQRSARGGGAGCIGTWRILHAESMASAAARSASAARTMAVMSMAE